MKRSERISFVSASMAVPFTVTVNNYHGQLSAESKNHLRAAETIFQQFDRYRKLGLSTAKLPVALLKITKYLPTLLEKDGADDLLEQLNKKLMPVISVSMV